MFFHRYFNQKDEREKARAVKVDKRKKKGADDDEDDDENASTRRM